ncbi:sugar phosphate isomerase/epimerase family protein [Larkinella sp. GY13]|uniref:sugar phosphate isomerase/epimerase family protein n=1 Tax=Larkinella sp. GY13 TaxID=3453720 RepID=UPI003EEB9C51
MLSNGTHTHLSRRDFVTSLTAGIASLAALPVLGEPAAKRLDRLGFIAGIVSRELKQDWQGGLKKAVAYGFSEMETGRFYGKSAPDFLRFCGQIGLNVIGGGGLSLSASPDKLWPKLDDLKALNAKYAVVYWPWLVSGPFTLSDCQRSAELINKMGEQCKHRGLALCWHNHDKEFIPMEAGLPFEYLMTHTDPALVKCEMDLYWVAKGGVDPLVMLQKYSDRYTILHVKDLAPGTDQGFVCPGSGIIDFKTLFAEAHRQGIRHYMVEQDNVVDGLGCLLSSGQYLHRLRF